MDIDINVPRSEKPVLRYMRLIKPVSATLEELIHSVRILVGGSIYEDLPINVKMCRAFDSTSPEAPQILDLLSGEGELRMHVLCSDLTIETGDLHAVLARRLERSESFYVSFSRVRGLPPIDNAFPLGFTVSINRDGSLHPLTRPVPRRSR